MRNNSIRESGDFITLFDLIKTVKREFDDGMNEDRDKVSDYSYNSAAASSSKLVAVFPLLVSKSVDASIAHRVSKYIESRGCIILQLALSANNIANSKNGMEYLRRFHQNLDIGGSNLNMMIQAMDDYIAQNESVKMSENTRKIKHELDIEYLNTLTESLYNLPTLYHSDRNLKVSSIEVGKIQNMLREADAESNKIQYEVTFGQSVLEADNSKNGGKDDDKEIIAHHDTVKMMDNDVKKMNAGLPTILTVKFYSDNDSRNSTSFIVGVKSKIVGVNSDEIIRRIYNDNSDGKFFFNFMKAFTGETSFIKDFLLGLSTVEGDISSIRKKGAKGNVWKILQNRAQIAKTALKQKRTNVAAAITTVVITQTDADYLFKQHNVDVTDPAVAYRFMMSYNLLGFIIVDDSTESLKIMFDDGDKEFEILSYNALEKDTSDNAFKKAITLMLKR